MVLQIDRQRLAERQARLDSARAGLKAYFVGIDRMIDELCDSIAVWYLMPEVLSRPVIVNLWGMTGVGKTDLVRRLVSILDIQEHFVEIEMSNGDTTTWHSSVASRLSDSGALSGEPTLLLFDEIQRFNTLNPDGSPVTNTKFSDFWELLSDGRLSRRESPDVEYLMASLYQNQAAVERRRAEGETVVDDTIGVWEGQQLKRQYGIPGELEELTQLTYAQAVELMKNVRRTKRIYEPIDCSRCLIVISGNLDEAFTMATAGAEADIDADIFAAFTDKITVVDIKRALVRRFKPEQVARFGNIHLIYSSLRRCDFEVLIRREIGRVIDSTQRTTGVTVSVGDAVAELIYRNGVFPVQGVRPVFSSVIDILETNLAKLIFRAVMDDEQRVTIDYDSDRRELIGTVGETVSRLPYTGRIDKIRDGTLVDKVANVAVHEAGHAVAYGVLFGLAPLQLTARVAATYVGGFTFPHQIYDTADSMLNQVKVLLAGGLAEEQVYGSGWASIGRNADRERATELLIDFVRRYGFDREFQANYMLELVYAMDRSVPEPDIEKMMTRLVAETVHLLSQHGGLLVDLASRLAAEGSLPSDAVAACMARHGVDAVVRQEGFQWIPGYRQELNRS